MANTQTETNGAARLPIDPVQLLDAGHRSANMIAAGAELMAKAMGEIVAKQTDFLRVEGDEIARCAAALALGQQPIEATQKLAEALRGGAEGALSDLREIQDLMRGCAWGLFGLYVDSISVAAGEGRPTHQ